MEAQLAALLRFLADAGEASTARAARRLGLAASELQRLLAVLGDDPVLGGLGLVGVREDGDRRLLVLTGAGRDWLARHRWDGPPTFRSLPARRVDADGVHERCEDLVEESAIALLYNGMPFAVMMATPADLEDFAVGFSVTEGIVDSAAEVTVVDCVAGADGISLQMHVRQAAFDALAARGRNLPGRTGCGLCGTDTLAAAMRPVRRVAPAALAAADWLPRLAELHARQPLNARTGGAHAAAVLDAAGTLHVREDVGRHCAIDKAVGAALRAGRVPVALLVTSRASYEVVHKAAQAGIGHVAAVSAPTALAVRLAGEAGLRLVGFARDGRHTVYAEPVFDATTAGP